MSLPQALLSQLSDGAFHSGPELGLHAGCSRSMVWKGIEALRDIGLDIYSVRGKGYRLAYPLRLLDREEISHHMDTEQRAFLSRLDIHFETDSTNARLLELARLSPISGVACFAERQTAGRGRRGRQWVSPFGTNLYASLLWRFPGGAAQLAGLSLAIAVAVVRSLQDMGAKDVQLKWPNDILWEGRKMAGLLLEMVGEASGPCMVVMGIGINISMREDQGDKIEQAWSNLQSSVGLAIDRNRLAGRLLNHVIQVLREFESHGLAELLEEWRAYDAFYAQEVSIHQPGASINGIALGVDDSGALLLSQEGSIRRFHSGEVSLRLRS